ncbi:MAG: hypothetical protein QOJ99_5263 [Bryobacterales bacterium]|jgi:uncharacterized protein YdeI (YjbR/CyaY-like superfamily)|nr:hypothetical protein [Bryobacterales bacterium]
MEPKFFPTAAAWHAWLEKNHHRQTELLVGFYKVGSDQPSMTWPESVDAALCFGWIDGVRRRIDDVSYSIRFTPRKARSIWSVVNIKRVEELTIQRLMHAAGLRAFAAREQTRSGVYAFEQENVQFEAAQEALFRANKAAWDFFQTQPAWYRRTATWRVVSAKKEETRTKRLAQLMVDSSAGRTIAELTRIKGPKKT